MLQWDGTSAGDPPHRLKCESPERLESCKTLDDRKKERKKERKKKERTIVSKKNRKKENRKKEK